MNETANDASLRDSINPERSQVKKIGAAPLNCDQVAWLLDIFHRYLPPTQHPRVCRQREMMKYAMLYEVMEIAHLQFEDDRARWNGNLVHAVAALR